MGVRVLQELGGLGIKGFRRLGLVELGELGIWEELEGRGVMAVGGLGGVRN